MTLINYPTRVHFGDGILEEALRAEMESRRRTRPLIVADAADLSSNLADRLFLSLPSRLRSEIFLEIPFIPDDAVIARLAELYRSRNCDLLVALGGRAAIELAKLARIAISRGRNFAGLPDASHTVHEPGDDQLPDLYVIPSFHGLTTAFSMQTIMNATWSGRIILTNRSFMPAVVILDPTLYIGADPSHSASALAEAIACCAEAYLAPEYNPPAEGIAMDGLVRAFRIIGCSGNTGDLASCREIVAAGLNGGLALQKGAGMTQTLSSALMAVADRDLDEGALSRVLLSGALHFNNDLNSEKYQRLRQLLGIAPTDGFVDFVAAKFGGLPLPVSLSKMGVGVEQLIAAAPIAAGDLSASKNPRRAGEQDLLGIMQNAF